MGLNLHRTIFYYNYYLKVNLLLYFWHLFNMDKDNERNFWNLLTLLSCCNLPVRTITVPYVHSK